MKRYKKLSVLPGLSGQALADLLGVSRSLISHWQAGRRHLPAKASAVLAELLQVHQSAQMKRAQAFRQAESASRLQELETRQEGEARLRKQKAEQLKKELVRMKEIYRQAQQLSATLEILLEQGDNPNRVDPGTDLPAMPGEDD